MRRSQTFIVQGIILFGMIGLVYLLLPSILRNGQVARIVPTIVAAVGLLILVAIAIIANRFKDVYDYESTTFLGRETNGKSIRSLLNVMGTFGCLFIVIGAGVLMIVVLLTVKPAP
jgi:hypothetical protein